MKGAVYTWEGGLKPKAQVVSNLEDEGHWKRDTFLKTKKLEIGCGVNSKRKAMAHWIGGLIFLKWSYPNGLSLDLPCSHWISPYQHSLISADFFNLSHFWAILNAFWQKSPGFLHSFKKLLTQGGSNKYLPLGLGNDYLKLPPRIPHTLFIH